MEQAIISGIAFNRDEAKITVLGVPDTPGHRLPDSRPDRRRQHRRRHDHPERRSRRHAPTSPSPCTATISPRRWTFWKSVKAHIGAREVDRRQQDLQGLRRRRRHALASGRRQQDVPHAGRRRHQHPDDLHLGNQDFGRGRREIPGTGRARAAQAFDLDKPTEFDREARRLIIRASLQSGSGDVAERSKALPC